LLRCDSLLLGEALCRVRGIVPRDTAHIRS